MTRREKVLAKEKLDAVGRKPYGVHCLNCSKGYIANKQHSLCPHDPLDEEAKP